MTKTPLIEMDVSEVHFVPDEVTRRRGDEAKSIAVEAFHLLTECAKAFDTTPHPKITVAANDSTAKRSAKIPTRFGEAEVSIAKDFHAQDTTILRVGSLTCTISTKWKRITARDMQAALLLFAHVARKIVQPEEAIKAELKIRAAVLDEALKAGNNNIVVDLPMPWLPGRFKFHTYSKQNPFQNGETKEFTCPDFASVRCYAGTDGPHIKVKQLQYVMNPAEFSTMERLHILSHLENSA